jgi:hypothetical protein
MTSKSASTTPNNKANKSRKNDAKSNKSNSVPSSPMSSSTSTSFENDGVTDRSSCTVIAMNNSANNSDDRRIASRGTLLVHATLLKRQRWCAGQLVAIRAAHSSQTDEISAVSFAVLVPTSVIDAHSRVLVHAESLFNAGRAKPGDAIVLSEASLSAPLVTARRVVVSLVDAAAAGRLPATTGSLDAMLKSQWQSLHVVVGNCLNVNGVLSDTCLFRIERVEPSSVDDAVVRLSSRTEYVLSNDSATSSAAAPSTSQTVAVLPPQPVAVGGLDSQRERLARLVELPLRRRDELVRLGVQAPRGVLLYGLAGCGKTRLARATAATCGANWFPISAPELVRVHVGDSESALSNAITAALALQPVVIFIDEVDAIAPRRDDRCTELERRMVGALLSCFDRLAGCCGSDSGRHQSPRRARRGAAPAGSLRC